MKFALGIICGTTAVLLAALIAPIPDVALAHLQAGPLFGLRVAVVTIIGTASAIFGVGER